MGHMQWDGGVVAQKPYDRGKQRSAGGSWCGVGYKTDSGKAADVHLPC